MDAFDENYIKEEKLNYFKNKRTEVEKLLNGNMKYLTGKLQREQPR